LIAPPSVARTDAKALKPGERRRDVDAVDLANVPRVERLDHREDVLLVDERHLHVELREFEAPIRARRLVAETAHDLVVAVLSRHHQQLLQLLRGLREGVERTRPQA
jgi:hypothetical protein